MFQIRYYQDEAVNSLFSYWGSGNTGNPLVALPTGTGKSVVIAVFGQRALYYYPSTRMLILTHVKELIQQNFDKLRMVWPGAPAGIYSAGIGRRDVNKAITFGGIQSVINNVEAFGHIDLVGIDEAHLVSPEDETRYMQVIARLRALNPHLKVFGLTATWWRKKQGSLTNEGLFTDIAYDRTKPDDFRQFIAEGFLSPLVAKATATRLDISNVGMVSGDFNQKQLEAAVDVQSVTTDALREACAAGGDRHAWIAFCSGIAHAEHVAELLNRWGIRTGCVHSKMHKNDRDRTIADWYAGKYRCVTNNDVLTTGIDYPALDFCIMLRPTMSSSKWVQMLGRLMRPCLTTGKRNALVLDFAGNTSRLGPVDDPVIPGKPRKGEPGDAPVKICEHCGTYNYASVRFCDYCGADFPTNEKLSSKSSDAPLMSSDLPVVEEFNVTHCTYQDYFSKAEKRSIRVTYHCGIRQFSEYVSVEGTGFALKKAHDWWHQRHQSEPPATVDDALQVQSELRLPQRIKVWVNKTWEGKPSPEIVAYEWY